MKLYFPRHRFDGSKPLTDMPVVHDLTPLCFDIAVKIVPVHFQVNGQNVQQILVQLVDALEDGRITRFIGFFAHSPADQLRKVIHAFIPCQYTRQDAQHAFLRDSFTHLHSPHS